MEHENTRTQQHATGLVLTPKEAALFLKVSKATINRMIKNGSLPAAKCGKQNRIFRSDIDKLAHVA